MRLAKLFKPLVLALAVVLFASPLSVLDAAERPFGPEFSVALKDPRPNTATLLNFSMTQRVGEPFLTNVEVDFPPQWQISLGALAPEATLADVEVLGQIRQNRYLSQGPLQNHSSHAVEPHRDPTSHHWVARLPDPSREDAAPFEVDVWATRATPDGHLHLAASLPESLVSMLEDAEASLLWVRVTFRRETSLDSDSAIETNVFSNPVLAGTYPFTVSLTGRDGSTVVRTATAAIG